MREISSPLLHSERTQRRRAKCSGLPRLGAIPCWIFVEGNLLTIKGTKEQALEEKAEKVHRYERNYGAFERTFTLPVSVQQGATIPPRRHSSAGGFSLRIGRRRALEHLTEDVTVDGPRG